MHLQAEAVRPDRYATMSVLFLVEFGGPEISLSYKGRPGSDQIRVNQVGLGQFGRITSLSPAQIERDDLDINEPRSLG